MTIQRGENGLLSERECAVLAALVREEREHPEADRWHQATDDELKVLEAKLA